MRTQIAKILLVLMTLSGIIIPIHAYAHELAESQDSHSIEMDSQHDTERDSISCDHCCHFSSHSLGLMQKNKSIANQQTKGLSNFHRLYYASINQPPPYHPPIA